jgi:hypothetical protein
MRAIGTNRITQTVTQSRGTDMKHFKTLGLCLMAALSLMAFVGATQASALWLESGATITSKLPGNAKIVGLENEHAVAHLVLVTPAKELEILCKAATALEGQLLSGTVLVSGKLSFSECQTFQKKVLSPGCKPSEPIVTEKILAHLILHPAGELTYVLIEPEAPATKFALFDFNEETCALPDTNIAGSVAAECLGEEWQLMATTKVDYCLSELKNHLITEAPRALFPSDVLKYGANETFIRGVLNVFLNTGNAFSGHV